MEVVENSYLELFRGEATCIPRCNLEVATKEPGKTYAMGITAGSSSASGYMAIRMQSDITYVQEYAGTRTREKYAIKPGTWCGLYMLFAVETGEPLAIMNDGYLQHMRQGADGGIGAKYMARENSEVLGMLGSGGMARTHAMAICEARPIKKMKVFSPTKANREAYAREIAEKLGIEVEAVATPQEAHEGVDILSTCADATGAVAFGRWIGEGTHIVYAAGGIDEEAAAKVDVTLRLGNTPSPRGYDWNERSDTVVWSPLKPEPPDPPAHRSGQVPLDREILLKDLLAGSVRGRTSASQITHSDRGGMRGVEHTAIAALAYERAKAKGIGREIPTEWFLEDIRD
jgi:ornithine cyclodeaminase/alanine dehydrogenase-like protein (mu-crystallin family)